MNSRERVTAALQLKEPDRVPFMDFVDTVVKQKIMGTGEIDEVEFAKKKMKMVADAIKLPWAFHSDGNLTIVMEDLLSLGMNCVNPFEPPVMDIKVAKEKWGDRICLWGNIDLVQTLPYGTVEEVEAEVRQRIREAGPGGGYICASANSLTGFCKIENIFAMTNAVKKFGPYPLDLD